MSGRVLISAIGKSALVNMNGEEKEDEAKVDWTYLPGEGGAEVSGSTIMSSVVSVAEESMLTFGSLFTELVSSKEMSSE